MDKKWPFSVETRSVDTGHGSTRFILGEVSPQIQQWSPESHDLEEPNKAWTVIAYDTILLILPLALLAKAIIVAVFGGAGNTDGMMDLVPTLTTQLVNFNEQLVTLYTVVFGTIVGTLVKRYALWKAEQGASVGELEQLQSSVSLPKTLGLVWSLRSLSFTSMGLVFIWS
jgi:hypothetical protein